VWQLHNKYLFVPVEGGVVVVDQHVAHERVLYERARARLDGTAQPSQQLLFGQTLELTPAEAALLVEIMEHVTRLGFTVRMFGGTTVMVEGIPADVRGGAAADLLREVLDEYREEQRSSGPDVREALAKSYACRAAIKAGDTLNEREQRALLEQLFATAMPYVCPHGRPVLFRLSLQELDRRFGRT
jgi:DNA mismatch repair protein MutL